MTTKLTDPVAFNQTAESVAAELHEVWRRGHIAAKGNTPRWKSTTDKAWCAAHTGAPYYRSTAGGDEVDINVPFAALPEDWRAENLAAARFAVRVVMNALLLGEPVDLELLSHQVHEAWLCRQRLLPVAPGQPPYYRTSGQDVPYASLPESEKEKDRDQVRLAETAVRALLP